MSGDVTIPREDAKRYAHGLRAFAERLPASDTEKVLVHLADLLDPPPVSLRDEVADIVRVKNSGHFDGFYAGQADAILAVVRTRIEALPVLHVPNNEWLYRDDVLRLLGATDV